MELGDQWGALQGYMLGSIFFHIFILHLQKGGINEVTKFTDDNVLMIIQCTKGSHKKM